MLVSPCSSASLNKIVPGRYLQKQLLASLHVLSRSPRDLLLVCPTTWLPDWQYLEAIQCTWTISLVLCGRFDSAESLRNVWLWKGGRTVEKFLIWSTFWCWNRSLQSFCSLYRKGKKPSVWWHHMVQPWSFRLTDENPQQLLEREKNVTAIWSCFHLSYFSSRTFFLSNAPLTCLAGEIFRYTSERFPQVLVTSASEYMLFGSALWPHS